jgi:hypothetical protein
VLRRTPLARILTPFRGRCWPNPAYREAPAGLPFALNFKDVRFGSLADTTAQLLSRMRSSLLRVAVRSNISHQKVQPRRFTTGLCSHASPTITSSQQVDMLSSL